MRENSESNYKYTEKEEKIDVEVPNRFLLEADPIQVAKTKTNDPEKAKKLADLIEHEQNSFKKVTNDLRAEARDRMAERYVQAIKIILNFKDDQIDGMK